MIYCPRCATTNRLGSKYCNECGAALPQEQPQAQLHELTARELVRRALAGVLPTRSPEVEKPEPASSWSDTVPEHNVLADIRDPLPIAPVVVQAHQDGGLETLPEELVAEVARLLTGRRPPAPRDS